MAIAERKEFAVNAGGLSIHVTVQGAGAPLLLLNGLGAGEEVLTPLRGHLSNYKTITLDPPGVGKSGDLDWPMRLPAHADIGALVLDALGEASVDVLGLSWGGALAQELARRHPQRISRMVLVSTTPGPALLTSPDVYCAFFNTADRGSRMYAERVVPTLFGGQLRSESVALYEQGVFGELARKTSKRYLMQMAAAAGWTSLHYAWRLKQPALIITGDDDPIVRPYNSRLLNCLLPHSRLAVIEGEGHLLVVTSAERVAALINDFLARDPVRQAA